MRASRTILGSLALVAILAGCVYQQPYGYGSGYGSGYGYAPSYGSGYGYGPSYNFSFGYYGGTGGYGGWLHHHYDNDHW